MSLELRVLSGARTGQRATYDQPLIAIGRHPQSDLRFDPESDRDVSARHAEIKQQGSRWILSDASSTNGTFVNGNRITGDHELRNGDVVWFGVDGPRVEVHLPRKRVSSDDVVPTRISLGAPITAAKAVPSGGQNTTERIAIAVKQQTRGLQYALGALAVLLIGGAGAGVWFTSRQSSEVRAMIARSDSLSRVIEQQSRVMSNQVGGLDSALAQERAKTRELRQQIAGGSASEVAMNQLEQSLRRSEHIVAAGQIDYTAIGSASGRAVVLIFVETQDGKTFSGTGFGVSNTGVLVTNKHLMVDEQGRNPKRIAVVYSDTKDGLPAKVIRIAQDGSDLAVLQITEAGTRYPVVRGIAGDRASIRAGAPVAIIGYPLGLDTPMDKVGDDFTARSTLGAGILSKTLDNVLQIDAFAGQGSSGSPVFDASGRVIGVVYGGAAESGGRIVYAVPPEKVLAEMRAAGVPR
jgi:pSer/pThr/pTyr-binding forkhead associated (FHA) protein/V8-like Glu-specific endopeptidase